MDLAEFREYCLTKPGASEETPFGPDVLVFKVGGKIFALAALDEVPPRVNVKCDPDLALDLRDRYDQVTPGYHMTRDTGILSRSIAAFLRLSCGE